MQGVVFDDKSCTYQFTDDTNSNWSIKEVWPIQMNLNIDTGKTEFTVVYFCRNMATNFIEFNYCT